MPAAKLTSATSAEFLDANKEAVIVLFFDAEFSGQQDIVDNAIKALQEASDLNDKIVIGTVDVEANNELASKFSVLSVPMVACIRDNKVLKKIDNLDPSKLVTIIRELLKILDVLTGGENATDLSVDTKSAFKEYLKKLTTREQVMVFMKGTPQQPRCGFSRQLVELLAKYDIKYGHFDILLDDDVRQGLKEYSDWPTYPQIYVKGEFIGGLDILKQMEDSGELESTLKV